MIKFLLLAAEDYWSPFSHYIKKIVDFSEDVLYIRSSLIYFRVNNILTMMSTNGSN